MIMIAFALISNTIVSASQRIVTDMDCEVTNSRDQPWGATWYGPFGGGKGGSTRDFAGRLFEFDCQRNCVDADSDRGSYWVTCGYSYRDVEDLQDSSLVMVEVKTEAYNDGFGDCGGDWTRPMGLDSTGWSAIDTQGDQGHYGFHICYKLDHWGNVKSSGGQVITDLKASTRSSISGYVEIADGYCSNRGSSGGDDSAYSTNVATIEECVAFVENSAACGSYLNYGTHDGWCDCVPAGDSCQITSYASYKVYQLNPNHGYTRIGQWDTDNNGKAKAYGNQQNTKHWLYFFMTKAIPDVPSEAKVIGQWNYETVNRPLNSDIQHKVTKHFESSESSEATESDMSNWNHQIAETHKVEVAVQASANYGAYSGGIEARYGYEYDYRRSETFQSYLENIASKTFSQSMIVEEEVTIPKQVEGEPIYVNIWYFKTDVINDDYASATHYSLSGGVQTHGCGYSIPPNCLPGFCHAYDPHCWECTSAAAIIDPDFVPPPECADSGEGCTWYPLNATECPSSEISAALPGCNEAMENGELCEADSSLPNGVFHNINNCGKYDIFRYMCD